MQTLVPSLSHSFSHSAPSPLSNIILSFALTLAHSSFSYSLSLYPPPLPATALFKYPLSNFLPFLSLSLSLFFSLSFAPSPSPCLLSSLSLSLFHSLPLCLAQTSSSVSSDRVHGIVEAAQAAEGHRSQLWTYLDRQAKSEVWTSFARRPCR